MVILQVQYEHLAMDIALPMKVLLHSQESVTDQLRGPSWPMPPGGTGSRM